MDKKRTPLILFTGVLLLLDQMTKYFFSDSVSAYCNPIGSWGISVDNGMLIAIALVVLVGSGYLFRKSRGIPFGIAFAFLFAGGVSNLLDRIFFGCVRDFSLIPWFPAFNMADVLLTIGMIVFLSAFFSQRKNPRE